MNEFEKRVARGMAALDKTAPDWEFRIKPENITSIDSPFCCVLKEVFGHYTTGLNTVFPAMVEHASFCDLGGHWFGFGYGFGFAELPEYDSTLTATWQAAIAARRSAVTLEPARVETL